MENPSSQPTYVQEEFKLPSQTPPTVPLVRVIGVQSPKMNKPENDIPPFASNASERRNIIVKIILGDRSAWTKRREFTIQLEMTDVTTLIESPIETYFLNELPNLATHI
jgi:hypothetical protein